MIYPDEQQPRKWYPGVPLVVGIVLLMLVAHLDQRHAGVEREAAAAEVERLGREFKQGHNGKLVHPYWKEPIILMGDSITELTCDIAKRGYYHEWPGWAHLLSERYVMRRDVFNRGFGGYTTRTYEPMFEDFLKALVKEGQDPALVTIYLGANDAVFDHLPHSVPLPTYTTILTKMVHTIRTLHPTARILLITPPPPACNADVPRDIPKHANAKGERVYKTSSGLWRNGERVHTRTKDYRDAVRKVCEDMSVDGCAGDGGGGKTSASPPVDGADGQLTLVTAKEPKVALMDTWRMLLGGDGETYDFYEADKWYMDGLHYNKDGERRHFEHMMDVVQRVWPELHRVDGGGWEVTRVDGGDVAAEGEVRWREAL
ncbi:hypothetical protein HK101_000951 [Irineochytrium annulatum]|nr:hypothetical protein HK101_000951 [Irineochytrium annulatum]